MALTLRVSRALGMAPLRMKRARSGWCVSYSRPYAYYSFVLKILLDVLVSVGLLLDLCAPKDRKQMVNTATEGIVWCVGLILFASITSIGVFTGRERMKTIIECLNLVSNIQSKAGGIPKRPSTDFGRICFIIFILFATIVLFSGNLLTFFLDAIFLNKEFKVIFFYVAVFVEYFTVVLLELQFILTGFLVESLLKGINQQIELFVSKIDLEVNKSYSLLYTSFIATAIPVPNPQHDVSVVRKTDDLFRLHKKILYTRTLQRNKAPHSTVRDDEVSSWASSYSVACEVLRKIDDSFSVLTALMLGCIFFFLVTTPYYLTFFILSSTSISKNISITVHAGYMVWFILQLVMLTEPGSRIGSQMFRMQNLLSHVLRRMTSEDDQSKLLDCFLQQVLLYQPSFSTCGISKMTRPLIIAVFAGITTYITMVVQLEHGDAEMSKKT